MEYKMGSQNAFPNSNIFGKLLNVIRLKDNLCKIQFRAKFSFPAKFIGFYRRSDCFPSIRNEIRTFKKCLQIITKN
ncbi:MAG TPA: hypothetical protein DIS75_05185 [Chryseobacterium sp.]|nr:hypothetical protein [Chryseobacterium sp.]